MSLLAKLFTRKNEPEVNDTRIEVTLRNNGTVYHEPQVFLGLRWHDLPEYVSLRPLGLGTLEHAKASIDHYLGRQAKEVTYIKYP